MNNKTIKKIIAKEGLILLAFIILSCLFIFVIANIPDYKAYKINTGEAISGIVWDDYKAKMQQIGVYIILLGYPAYLLIHFIIWAGKILKQK